jgi:hypothetical protein
MDEKKRSYRGKSLGPDWAAESLGSRSIICIRMSIWPQAGRFVEVIASREHTDKGAGHLGDSGVGIPLLWPTNVAPSLNNCLLRYLETFQIPLDEKLCSLTVRLSEDG